MRMTIIIRVKYIVIVTVHHGQNGYKKYESKETITKNTSVESARKMPSPITFKPNHRERKARVVAVKRCESFRLCRVII